LEPIPLMQTKVFYFSLQCYPFANKCHTYACRQMSYLVQCNLMARGRTYCKQEPPHHNFHNFFNGFVIENACVECNKTACMSNVYQKDTLAGSQNWTVSIEKSYCIGMAPWHHVGGGLWYFNCPYGTSL